MRKLAYYGQQFPFPQGATAGPYPQFAGMRAMPQGNVIMVGRRVIKFSPQGQPRQCFACQKPQAEKMRARRRHLGAMGDAGLPAGSALVYNATWPNSLLSKISTLNTYGGSGFTESAVVAGLAAQGIIVDSSTTTGSLTTGTSGFTLSVHTTSDRNQATDVQSVIDHQVYLALGIMPQSAIATRAISQQIPSTPAGTPVGTNNTAAAQDLATAYAAQAAGDTVGYAAAMTQYQIDSGASTAPFSLATWLTTNWMLVAAGVGAALLVKEIA